MLKTPKQNLCVKDNVDYTESIALREMMSMWIVLFLTTIAP
jgi:hypothetical protein